MPPEDRDLALLRDMVNAARRAAEFLGGLKLQGYLTDGLRRSAVERQIEIVGEAARFVSSGFKAAHPEVPWRLIMAQRNVLAHEYGDIDDEMMWRTATLDVPALLQTLEPLVPPPEDTVQN